MRDHSVDQMVEIAKSCAPGGKGTKSDAVRAIRMCFEIMELMKLVSFFLLCLGSCGLSFLYIAAGGVFRTAGVILSALSFSPFSLLYLVVVAWFTDVLSNPRGF